MPLGPFFQQPAQCWAPGTWSLGHVLCNLAKAAKAGIAECPVTVAMEPTGDTESE